MSRYVSKVKDPETGCTTVYAVVESDGTTKIVLRTFQEEEDAYVYLGQCPRRVYSGSRDWSGHVCQRLLRDGAELCGLHLGAIKRRENKRLEEEQDRERRGNVEAAVRERVAGLAEQVKALGLESYSIQPHYYRDLRSYRLTGDVVVSAALLESLLNLIGELS